MSDTTPLQVGGYALAEDRLYDRERHLWVAPTAGRSVRLGFDPLGSETCGDIVAVSFEPLGTTVARGEPFGTLEAAKFVGPLIAPVSGTLRAHNEAVLAHPGQINQAPLESWFVELEPSRLAEERAELAAGRAEIAAWFAAEIERFRTQGMIAE